MRFMQYNKLDTANGPGFRSSLFVSGCSLKCLGCWNPESWNPRIGQEFTQEVEDQIVKDVSDPNCAGMSILGGDVFFEDNFRCLASLVGRVSALPGKTIWCWTGYLLEDLLVSKDRVDFLSKVDTLVDGPFEQDKRDLTLQYRGSRNQRVWLDKELSAML